MGQLHEAINVTDIVYRYKIDAMVETGTGLGSTVSTFAKQYPSMDIYTIEGVLSIFDQAVSNLLEYPKVQCFFGTSSSVLPELLTDIREKNHVLFWLDAHFPGADFGLAQYGDTEDINIRLPLESELRLIANNRNIIGDYFVIDDLRVYEDGPFQDGIWAERNLYGGDGIDFIYDILGRTHNIKKLYSQQGYIIAEPK